MRAQALACSERVTFDPRRIWGGLTAARISEPVLEGITVVILTVKSNRDRDALLRSGKIPKVEVTIWGPGRPVRG
jgi:hypothetical protein